MSFESERIAIENHFEEFWNETPIAWENVAFSAPNNSAWVRLTILNGSSNYRTITGLKRHLGVIDVQIFTPINTGTNQGREYADTIGTIFEGKKFSDVVCDIASINTIGADSVWHQINVTIPYWRDS
jgi:hypothetical protein